MAIARIAKPQGNRGKWLQKSGLIFQIGFACEGRFASAIARPATDFQFRILLVPQEKGHLEVFGCQR